MDAGVNEWGSFGRGSPSGNIRRALSDVGPGHGVAALSMEDERPGLAAVLGEAERALADLDAIALVVPPLASSPGLLSEFCVRREAVSSARLAGGRAGLLDLLSWEADDETAAPDLAVEIASIARMITGQASARDEMALAFGELPTISLLDGLFRAIGGPGARRRAVPSELLASFERELRGASPDDPPLLRIARAHARLELLDPYPGHTDRIARMMVTLLLEQNGLLFSPILPLSEYFLRHRDEYARRLHALRIVDGRNDIRELNHHLTTSYGSGCPAERMWQEWFAFYLVAIAQVARGTAGFAAGLLRLVAIDRSRLLREAITSATALRLFEGLPQHPIVTVSGVCHNLSVSKPTATRAIDVLAALDILRERTGRTRDRSWIYDRLVRFLLLRGSALGEDDDEVIGPRSIQLRRAA